MFASNAVVCIICNFYLNENEFLTFQNVGSTSVVVMTVDCTSSDDYLWRGALGPSSDAVLWVVSCIAIKVSPNKVGEPLLL